MPQVAERTGVWPRRWRWRIALVLLLIVLVLSAGTWLNRDQIAGNLIDQTLRDNGLEASYDIASIGPRQQVIENLVLGDPAAPDLTVEKVAVDIEYGFGSPGIGRVEVTGARLFGSFREGVLSFGALDPILFAETDEPVGLPAIDLKLIDARARIDTDYGAIGIKLDGEGQLDDGFDGTLAATAPGIGVAGCSAESATVYGELGTQLGAIDFAGPMRLREVSCQGASLASSDIAAELEVNDTFSAIDGRFDIVASQMSGFEASGDTLDGSARLTWRDGGFVLRHELVAQDLRSPYGEFAEMDIDGLLRSAGGPLNIEWSAQIEGSDAMLPLGRNSLLSEARAASEGTLAAPLLAKLERNLANAARGGQFTADLTVRQSDGSLSVVVPEARLRSGNDETLLSVSRLSWMDAGRLSGNLATGGEGLPRIAARMEQVAGGALGLQLSMQEYSAGPDRIAIPQMVLRQRSNGALEFDGRLAMSGTLPGGTIEGFEAPLEGTYSASSGLTIGARCTPVRFARLRYFDLTMDRSVLSLCPTGDGPLLSYRDMLRVGARTGNATLIGDIADSPFTLAAESAVIRYPGNFTLEGLSAVIGEVDNAVRLSAANANGRLGDAFGGEFSEASAQIDVVPLNVDELSGSWRYESETFFIDDAAFRLSDRSDEQARFEALYARDATLQLATNALTANADLREPFSDRLITSVAIQHNLSTSVGRADIDVPGVVFDQSLQPDQLTYLASGVVADVVGIVAGTGVVEWNSDTLTSTGTFGTRDLDLAAAFGPVNAISGDIEFTDLLGLTTAPGQQLTIGSINPGIEVISGALAFQLTDGEIFALEDGRWPFMGGELILRPVTLEYGTPDDISYIFELVGLDAAAFVAQMELTNLGASGIFDGTVPIVFDAQGNGRIEDGLLISRPPGGNVAYIGELTYEDLGTISNYAFNALRSLDYSQMSIQLDGNLAGEIITKLQFDGISQGEGATSNFITRRLARLPIRFNINVRSENFFELATVVRSFFDASYLGNPVDRGLFNTESGRFVPLNPNSPAPPPDLPSEPGSEPEDTLRRPDEPPVQPPESEELP